MKSDYNNRAVFFDRDGVINHLIYRDNGFYSPRFLKDFQLYEDAVGAIKFLKKKSFYIIIISNQPDISRKNMNHEELQKIDEFLKYPYFYIKYSHTAFSSSISQKLVLIS